MAIKLNQASEIKWNLVNSLLAGGLVFFGAFTAGTISMTSVCAALGAALVVFLTKFKEYWANEEKEYSSTSKIFSFIA